MRNKQQHQVRILWLDLHILWFIVSVECNIMCRKSVIRTGLSSALYCSIAETDRVNVPLVAGLVAGGVLIIILVIIVAVYCYRRRKGLDNSSASRAGRRAAKLFRRVLKCVEEEASSTDAEMSPEEWITITFCTITLAFVTCVQYSHSVWNVWCRECLWFIWILFHPWHLNPTCNIYTHETILSLFPFCTSELSIKIEHGNRFYFSFVA